MLVQVNDKITDSQIRELLEYAVFFDTDQLEHVCNLYKLTNDNELYALEDEGEIIGVVGCRYHSNDLEILHLAVRPEDRLKGYGRGLLLEILDKKNPDILFAVTDEDGADFYRNVGFEVTSFTEGLENGRELFRSVYRAEEEAE
ncbi:N-acetylglutamate synthase-like GNAT family acetyltransferase [Fontibacillus solani]|uniref:Acetyltransferase (GNAT) domain-containing protein n=2 Tax=Fontibacillus TaxID=995014 RepID=A0A1G7NVQ9_9BACL|nr:MULTISPECIES: GNAT family N-acetyltransferase [Fontibacillus]MBA9087831.1 N-acetylglutamate synthase-like GNAT family acetyltransferase [Fontibacillus solani]SDF77987.1 Acetyltransferase (GNAT) domain-containing protein [Fontibacillus panacisegetis]